MKNFAFAAFAITALMAVSMAFISSKDVENPTSAPVEMKWYTWAEAIELQKTKPKKLMIDVYTHWCHWCKVMDQKTFIDPAVAEYLNSNFYPVKLNAEQKEDIVFNGETFKWVESGRNGVHTLAYALLDGKMGYPSLVYLNEKFERILVSPGYKDPAMLMTELKFTATEAYLTKSWEEYKAGK